jgi:hypothetical protein
MYREIEIFSYTRLISLPAWVEIKRMEDGNLPAIRLQLANRLGPFNMKDTLLDIVELYEVGEDGLPDGVKLPKIFGTVWERCCFDDVPFTREEQEQIKKSFCSFCFSFAKAVEKGCDNPLEISGYSTRWEGLETTREWVDYYIDYIQRRGIGPIPRPRRIVFLSEDDQMWR